MQLGKLPNALKEAHKDTDVTRRVEYFNCWIDRVTPEAAGVDGGATTPKR